MASKLSSLWTTTTTTESGTEVAATKEATKENGQVATEKHVFDDDYQWPSLFREADDMLQASLLIYVFTELRELARKGELKHGAEKVLELPVTSLRAIEVMEENKDILMSQMDDKDMNICTEALKAIHERCVEMTEEGLELSHHDTATLVAFSDDRSDEELVFAVGVDSWFKRVTVVFRGSVSAKDFRTDACIAMRSRRNPVASFPDQDDEVKLHSGFHEYLLETSKGREMSKFTEIMEYVVPLLREHPDYKLYVSGHSLGGALATLFAFEVAAANNEDYTIQTPVSVVSVASPKLGNESFRKAFQLLEEQGKLRHLRVANEMDPVTLTPPASSKVMLATLSPVALMAMSKMSNTLENEMYKHVGVRLKLLSDEKSKYTISYSTGSLRQDMFHPLAATTVSHHYGYEYSIRMLRVKEELEVTSLNELYKKRETTQ